MPSQGGAISGLLFGHRGGDHSVNFVGLWGSLLGLISGVYFGTIFGTLPTGELPQGGEDPRGEGGTWIWWEWGVAAGGTKYKGNQY